MKLTIQDVVDAPMFTVWENMRGKVECKDRGREWWDLFGGANVSDDVWDKACDMLGERLECVPILHAARDDDMAHEHGIENEFCDLEAALCLLEFGVSLIKLPDELECEGERFKYWRMYAVGPLINPWKLLQETYGPAE